MGNCVRVTALPEQVGKPLPQIPELRKKKEPERSSLWAVIAALFSVRAASRSKLAVGTALASLLAGAGSLTALHLRGPRARPALGGLALRPISARIKVRRHPGDERLRLAAQASWVGSSAPGRRLSGAFAHGAARAGSASAVWARRVRAERAFGQLRFARNRSWLGGGTSSAQSLKTLAADAFAQTRTEGGEVVLSESSSARAPSDGGDVLPEAPSAERGAVDAGVMRNYQSTMNEIKGLIDETSRLKRRAQTFFAAGLAPLGTDHLTRATRLAERAETLSRGLEARYGQSYQWDNDDRCGGQALDQGLSSEECSGTWVFDEGFGTDIPQAVEAERRSGYEYVD
ncbi:MAG: hypothetical protein PHU21_12390 [Elusimicrobia bacterium]|nr:hypothetical protein [Elusimicrobiota bacterium]